jgi:hypothetical protein
MLRTTQSRIFQNPPAPVQCELPQGEAKQLATAAFLNPDHGIVLIISNTANFDLHHKLSWRIVSGRVATDLN